MKTVLVSTLSVGDHFVLDSYSEEFNSLYLITETYSNGWTDCVELHSGKEFTFGREVPVIPVKVDFKVKFPLKEKTPANLSGKCGSCEYASSKDKTKFVNQTSYVRCMNPERQFRDEIAAHRARTTKCCKCYKAKEC